MSFRKTTIFFSLIILCLVALSGSGQTAPPENRSEYLETVWTTGQGLPQNSVNAIIQSRDGYLWLGTFGGLARFDGIKFTTYNSGNTPGLKSNRILALFEAADGTIWMGTQTDGVMSFKNGVGHTYTTADGVIKGFSRSLGQAGDGTIWVATEYGVSRFENGHFKTYTSADGVPEGEIWAIDRDENDHIRFLYNDKSVIFDGQSFRTAASFPALDADSKAAKFQTGTSLPNPSPLFRPHVFADVPVKSGAAPFRLKWLLEDSKKTLWASRFWGKGLFYFKNGRAVEYRNDFPIRSMIEDREQNLWVGTDGNGLIRLRHRYLSTLSTEDGLVSDGIHAVTGDGQNGAWIASASGLSHWQNGKITTYGKKDGLLDNFIKALSPARDGGLWVGTAPGLTYYKGGKFTVLVNRDGFIKGETTALLETADGRLWIGSEYGLHVMRDGGVSTFQKSQGLVNDAVRMLTETSDGSVWIGTTAGLSRYKDGKFTNYTTAEGLSNDYVRDLFEDEDGNLWLATYGGGLNLLRSDGHITPITTRHGLFDDFLSRILPDGRGSFWFLSNRGIFKARRHDLLDFVNGRADLIDTVSYGTEDGMKSSEGNGGTYPSGWRTPDGKMWFPTIKGVAVIDSLQAVDLPPPPTVIEQVLINREALTQIGEAIEIKPGQENIEIAYTGLSLTRSEQIKFKYKLEGLSADWVSAGTRRTAYYSYIPPGEYTFQVMAKTDGAWSEPASVKLIVRPPYYRTWWFFTLVILVVTALAIGLFLLRVRQLDRRNAAQEEFSRRLINAHEAERRRIAAELHDSIGQSLAMIKNSATSGCKAVEDLNVSRGKFEEISTESTLAISEVREIAFNLRPYLIERLGLTKAIGAMLNKIADNFPLKIISAIDDLDELFENEAEISIYRIIQESLNNVVKHAEATEVRVLIERDEQAITIKIKDNGKGFNPNLPDRKKSGFGLIGIGERARMLGGTFSIESENGIGTTVLINLHKSKS